MSSLSHLMRAVLVLFSLLLVVCVSIVEAHGAAHDETHHDASLIHKCNTKSPSLAQSMAEEALLRFRVQKNHGRRDIVLNCNELCNQCITIEMYVHMLAFQDSVAGTYIPHPTSAFESYNKDVSTLPPGGFTSEGDMKALVDKQMDYINNAYNNTPFRFQYATDNPVTLSVVTDDWGIYGGSYHEEISRQLYRGESQSLNLYLVFNAGEEDDSPNSITYGFTFYPHNQLGKEGDGIWMRYDTLVDGGAIDTDTGETLVHEVGHWLGLRHVFDETNGPFTSLAGNPIVDPCDPDHMGDFIDDTPQMSMATDQYLAQRGISCLDVLQGTASEPDTCPNQPGNDPVFNYMNYLDKDLCFTLAGEFTCDQKERMHLHWHLFRDHVSACENDNEMEIELVVKFDPSVVLFDTHVGENHFLLREKGSTENILSSRSDAENDFVYQKTLLVDVCVPNDKSYELILQDKYADGFETGYFEIWLNGILLKRVEGMFESPLTVPISLKALSEVQNQTPTPAPSPSAAILERKVAFTISWSLFFGLCVSFLMV